MLKQVQHDEEGSDDVWGVTRQSLIWRNAGRAHFGHARVIPFEKET